MREQRELGLKMAWSILMPFLIYFIVYDLSHTLLLYLLTLIKQTDIFIYHEPTVRGAVNAVALMIGMGAVLPMALKEISRAKEEKQDGNPGWKEYLMLLVFAASLAMGANILLSLIGVTETSQTYQEVSARQFGVSLGVGIILYGIVVPVAEEVVFRGLMYNRMKHFFGATQSIILCGILFGVYHGNLVQGIYGCIMGIGITYMYEKYGSFLAPVLFHSVANICVFAAGYDQKVVAKLFSPINCAVFMIISILSFFIIRKTTKTLEK